jgi:outer membrane lipoprotein
MKRLALLACIAVLCASCASPVLRKDLIDRGIRDVSPVRIAGNPSAYMGKLFVVGGIIAAVNAAADGTTIEAVYAPVDKNGRLRQPDHTPGRYLAFCPKEKGFLDPLMYGQGRRITLAGTLTDLRTGTIGQMSYVFPVFRIEELYLWSDVPRSYAPATFFSFGVLLGG